MISQIDQTKEKALGELSDKYELKLVVLFEREPSIFFALKLYAWKVFVDTKLFRDNYLRIVKERVLVM